MYRCTKKIKHMISILASPDSNCH